MADVVREIKHDDDEKPVMILRKKPTVTGTFKLERPGIKTFAIRLNDAWQYSEESNPTKWEYLMYPDNIMRLTKVGFEPWMEDCSRELCKIFDLGRWTEQKMNMLASVIQGGLDDLVNFPPPMQKVKIVGEVEYLIKSLHGKEANIQGVAPIRDMNPVKED